MTEAMDATDAPSGLFDRSRAIRSARIPAGAKLVLEAIADCGEACFLKQQTMAIKTGLGLRAVSKWISWLKDAGIVESTRTGRSSHYSVSWGALASAGDTNQGAHQMRTRVRIRCARACASDAHEGSYQMRTSVRIASDSINGPSNGSRNEHPNAVVVKEDSRSMTGADLCRMVSADRSNRSQCDQIRKRWPSKGFWLNTARRKCDQRWRSRLFGSAIETREFVIWPEIWVELRRN